MLYRRVTPPRGGVGCGSVAVGVKLSSSLVFAPKVSPVTSSTKVGGTVLFPLVWSNGGLVAMPRKGQGQVPQDIMG